MDKIVNPGGDMSGEMYGQLFKLTQGFGQLEGDMRAIRDLLKEANEQRREFQGDIRVAVTEMQTFIPKIESHDVALNHEKTGVVGRTDRIERKIDRAKWAALGTIGASGAIGTSPQWTSKIAAIFQAIWP